MNINRERHRVLNLIKCVNPVTANPKKRAVVKLLGWQPLARRIRFEGRCDVCKSRHSMLLSYQLGTDEPRQYINHRGLEYEDCGFYCPSCQFGNAGGRPVQHKRSALSGHTTRSVDS